jgi:hypothetical protein
MQDNEYGDWQAGPQMQPYLRSMKSCSWCHTMNLLEDNSICRECGHRADVPRLECTCLPCQWSGFKCAGEAVEVKVCFANLAALAEAALKDSSWSFNKSIGQQTEEAIKLLLHGWWLRGDIYGQSCMDAFRVKSQFETDKTIFDIVIRLTPSALARAVLFVDQHGTISWEIQT